MARITVVAGVLRVGIVAFSVVSVSSIYLNSFVVTFKMDCVAVGELLSISERSDVDDNVDDDECEDWFGDGLVAFGFGFGFGLGVRKFFKFFKCCIFNKGTVQIEDVLK